MTMGVDREVTRQCTHRCRLEKSVDRATAWWLHEVLLEISSLPASKELVLDFDGTANPLHSQQEGHIIHGYYDSYGYLPQYMFCDQQLLCAYLRTSHIDGVQHAAAILRLLVRRLRTQWPDVRTCSVGIRAFAASASSTDASAQAGTFIVRLARNARLQAQVAYAELSMKDRYGCTELKQRLIDEFDCAEQSWPHERRAVTKA